MVNPYAFFLFSLKNHSWPSHQFRPMVVGGKYVNPFPEYRPQTVYEFIFCRIYELFQERPRGGVPTDLDEIRRSLPARRPDFELLLQTSRDYQNLRHNKDEINNANQTNETDEGLPPVADRLTLTWMGQSCAFVQMAGLNVLTDPCFGKHLVSPYLGPKRISPPPCQLAELPKVDLVLVSHDHPDHLELETVAEIGNSAMWIVPTGVGKHLESAGVEREQYRELTWWQTMPLPGTDARDGWEIACTPAMHWSGRKMLDANTTLWCSFVVLRHGKPMFFHAGDTGYSYPLFAGIRRVFGAGCKVAMVPCGAYTPRWHLRSQHTNPQEAVQIMKDLAARKLVGVHWGTFVLSEEHFLEPRDLLHSLAAREKRSQDIVAPEFGRTLVFNLADKSDAADDATEPTEPDTALDQVRPIRNGSALLFD